MKKTIKLLFLLAAAVLLAVIFAGCIKTKSFTVTFKNGGETVTTAAVAENAKAYPAYVATEEGVTFDGWYTAIGEEGRKFDFKKTAITSDITLYARFTTNLYAVTYNLNGAEGTPPTQTSVNANGTFDLPAEAPVRLGYVFLGWSDGVQIYEPGYNYAVDSAEHILLTAVWEYRMLKVRFFDGEGVLMEGYDKDIPYNGDVVTPNPDLVPLPNFYSVFDYWETEDKQRSSLENITEDTDLYAVYKYSPSDLSLFTFKLNPDGEGYSVAAKNRNISGKIALPDSYNGMPVRAVAKQGFVGCYYMTLLYVPSSYRTIKAEAFYSSGLTEIYIAEGLKTIEAGAFKEIGGIGGSNPVTVFSLPASIDDIHWWAFGNMFRMASYENLAPDKKAAYDNFKFTTADGGFYVWDEEDKALYGDGGKELVFVSPSVALLNVKDTVKEIFPMACYHNLNLTDVNILGDVTDIGPGAFANCINLTGFSITGSVANLWGSELQELDGVKVTSGALNESCSTFRSNTIGVQVPMPTESVFYKSAVSTLVFPDGLKHIGIGTFFRCENLTEVTLPGSVEYISPQAFQNHWMLMGGGLNKIVMPDGEGQKYYVDQNKALIEKGTGIKKLDGTNGDTFLFYCMDAPGADYIIPDNVTSLTPFAFAYNANLITLKIPEGVEEIPVAFCQEALSLSAVDIPASVKYITNNLPIAYTEPIVIRSWGNVVMYGEYGAFAGCEELMSINFAQNSRLEVISEYSFNQIGCSSFSVPASVTHIGAAAITGRNLTAINVDAQNAYYCSYEGALFTKDMKTLLIHPAGKSITEPEYTVPGDVEIIESYAFFIDSNIRKVIMGAGVKEIRSFAFANCYQYVFDQETGQYLGMTGLEEVAMGAGLEIINDDAFYYCLCLTEVSFLGPAPKLVKGSWKDYCTSDIFGMLDFDFEMGAEVHVLYENLAFVVPDEYLLDYYLEWHKFSPYYVAGFDAGKLPTITYAFDTKGGSPISDKTGVILSEMPLTSKENSFFWGWYSADCNEYGIWDETKKIDFPYVYKGSDSAILYARWSDKQLENGQKDIWSYILTPDKYARAEIPAGAYVWFSYTPASDCCVSLSGLHMLTLNYFTNYFCFNALNVDISSDDVWNYLVFQDGSGYLPLTAGTTYYFMIQNLDETDYIAYVAVQLSDAAGIPLTTYAALPSKKFDLA